MIVGPQGEGLPHQLIHVHAPPLRRMRPGEREQAADEPGHPVPEVADLLELAPHAFADGLPQGQLGKADDARRGLLIS